MNCDLITLTFQDESAAERGHAVLRDLIKLTCPVFESRRFPARMKIYVDFDDCLCETARAFSALAAEMFGINVPYEDMNFFELDKTFGLNDKQFEALMIRGHEPEVLLSFEETPGASSVINEWLSRGHDVSIITGRPYSAFDPSRDWLDRHGLRDVKLFCFDKYGRDAFIKNAGFSLEPEDYYRMKFDLAVEDSPKAFKFFDHLPQLRVLVFDRPWNRNIAFPDKRYTRCFDWPNIRDITVR